MSRLREFEEPISASKPSTRGALATTLGRLEASRNTATLSLWLGEVEVGRIEVVGGEIRTAEIPGARGEAAVKLALRIPNVRVVVTAGEESEPASEFDDLFAEATRAYARRQYREAHRLFLECSRLDAGEPRVLHNLKLLTKKIDGADAAPEEEDD